MNRGFVDFSVIDQSLMLKNILPANGRKAIVQRKAIVKQSIRIDAAEIGAQMSSGCTNVGPDGDCAKTIFVLARAPSSHNADAGARSWFSFSSTLVRSKWYLYETFAKE